MPDATKNSIYVYVGTYTRKESKGIHVYTFDPTSGALDLASVAEIENPSYLALHPNKQVLYAVGELSQFQGRPTGAVSAFAIDAETGALTLLNQQPSEGQGPCYVTVDRAGAYVYLANYGSGTAAVFPILEDGRLGEASDRVQHEGSGPNPNRQQGPHAHSINLDPDNRFAFVADLGIDRLMIYRVDETPGTLVPHTPPYTEVTGGSGPRHFDFHPSGRYAYLINEMGNTMMAFDYDPEQGALEHLQTVPTLPEDFDGKNTTADIHVHPTGAFLYGSNRGHDSVVAYAIDAEDGTLSYVDRTSTQGATPRNFALDPTGTYLVAANQNGDNLVTFRIDPETGKLTPTGHETPVSMPVCVKFLVP
jgi:6-phosphogluconolactonase